MWIAMQEGETLGGKVKKKVIWEWKRETLGEKIVDKKHHAKRQIGNGKYDLTTKKKKTEKETPIGIIYGL